MRRRFRLRKLIFWSFALVLSILAGALGFAYSYVTDSDTLSEMLRREAPRFVPDSMLHVARVQMRPFLGVATFTQVQLWQRIEGVPFPAMRIDWLNVRHDLPALLDGRLEPIEVVIVHPVLRLCQRSDGSWNMEGFLADPWPGPPLTKEPVVQIKRGEIELVDLETARNANGSVPLDPASVKLLSDVTIKAEPIGSGVMRFEGTASGGPFERLRLQGTIDVHTGRVELTGGDLSRLAVPEALRRLPRSLRESIEHAGLRGGEIDLVLKRFLYDPANKNEPVHYAASAQLRGSSWECLTLPFRMDDVAATANVEDGRLSLIHVQGRNGKTIVQAHGTLSALDPAEGPMDVTVDVTELELDGRLRSWLPPEQWPYWDDFHPSGRVDLAVHAVRTRAGEEPEVEVGAVCQDVSMTHARFPYPLEHIRGTVVWKGPTIQVDLRTVVGSQWLTGKGVVENPGDDAIVTLTLAAGAMPIDETLLNALDPEVREVVRGFNPNGSVRGTVWFKRSPPPRPGEPEVIETHASLDLNEGCSIRWVGMPYLVNDLTGHLDLHPDHWIFKGMKGRNGQALITADGEVIQNLEQPELPGVRINLKAEHLPFDQQLRESLPPEWKDSWTILRPRGSSRVAAAITAKAGEEPHYHLEVVPEPDSEVHLTLTPITPGDEDPEPIQLPSMEDVRGRFVFDDGTVTMTGVRFIFREAPVTCRAGEVILRDGGQFSLKVADLEVSKLRLDAELRKIMPAVMAQFAQRLDDGRPFSVHTDLGIAWSGQPGQPARCDWSNATVIFDGNTIQTGLPVKGLQGQIDHLRGWSDGWTLALHGQAQLDSVLLTGIQITSLKARIDMEDGWARFQDIKGDVLGGTLRGQASVSLDETPRYTAQLQLIDADLARLAATLEGHQDIRGLVSAGLDLKGLGNDMRKLQGTGEAHLTGGNLGQLPFMIQLLRPLRSAEARRASGNNKSTPAFDSADVAITIQEGRAELNPVKFLGSAVSLQGSGTLELQGDRTIDLRLSPLYGRDERRLPLLNGAAEAARELTGQVFDLHVVGPITEPVARLEPLPSVLPGVVRRLGGRGERGTR